MESNLILDHVTLKGHQILNGAHHSFCYTRQFFCPSNPLQLGVKLFPDLTKSYLVADGMAKVQLYIYDLSQGLALQLSPMFLGNNTLS